MNLPSGGRVGGYEVVGLVGAGGMGELYRARDPKRRRDVALKILPPRDPPTLTVKRQPVRGAGH